MEQTLINLVLALTANELLHNIVEIADKQERLRCIGAYIRHEKHDNLVTKDNLGQSYLLSFLSFLTFVTIFFGFFALINLEKYAALWTMIILLAVTYFITVILSGSFRAEAMRLMKRLNSRL